MACREWNHNGRKDDFFDNYMDMKLSKKIWEDIKNDMEDKKK